MSDRSIRRAAEREARKAARQAANLQAAAERLEALRNDTARNDSALGPISPLSAAAQARLQLEHDRSFGGFPSNSFLASSSEKPSSEQPSPQSAPAPEAPRTTASPAQLAANRENAQKSTGPTSEEGKARIRFNAVTTGLTGRTVCLPTDDAALYQSLITSYEKLFQPVGPEEAGLVQSLADIRWRLDRIPGLHMALLNKGRFELIEQAPPLANDPSGLLDIQVMLRYEKQFRNLELQEARLARRRDKETAELRRLQQERKANEAAALERAAAAHLLAKHRNQPFDNPGIGFEFSTQRFETYLASLNPLRRDQLLQKALAEAPEQSETMQSAA
jgi:hypothetical protein